ncbi:hypothetical protein COCSUDRAFT_32796 [Coccomyxa subellipsoidea C-169]|uniref:Uncharacterized protein n=1 Tax=Coccomyxa subellipsoidea (strain C-169) TaxID=574566 RepID=I0Z239_COCSC|nr:hypothetical protein COCSUDRAFT_32796 [Coccomyxa subellipsoidea C-169]EIE24708.1 hypothetical protein COCSUDRAFT_32796 [Coccomyxa subellipsoidea C-169]|eukprot:XP_005649252.1 hypothetical protein COCSUDRAFT_32796 [Coccomyxa subellipsoidea C-169]
MPPNGVLRTLRDLWRQARTYGDTELAQLKASAEDLKSQVDILREAQKKRRQQEEFLALRELRRTVNALKAESEALEQQKRAVVAAMDEVASNAEGEMAVQAEVQAQERVGKVLKAIEVEKFIAGAPLEESIRLNQELPIGSASKSSQNPATDIKAPQNVEQ